MLLAAALLLAGCRDRSEVTVFCAASLHPVLADAAARFEREQRDHAVSLQPSGSLVAARKLVELGMKADLIAVADADIIDRMLAPGHATWNLLPVANEMVIAHRDHSPFTDRISTDDWREYLLREEVRLGCTDPDTAPLGYRTLFTWQLAGYLANEPGLANRLRARCAPRHVAPDEEELVKLLEARAIDYAFIYRSTADSHHLKVTALPPQANLSRPELADQYAAASVEIRMSRNEKTTMRGRPIVYGLTIPEKAPNRKGAVAFTAFLLGEQGRQAFERAGFRPLAPAPCRRCDTLPEPLRPLVAKTP